MITEDLTRRLSAILSADVEGYSLLMRDDEEATVHTLTTYRNAMTHIINQYRGRVVDSPGDNVLAEFTSVVDAVNCGVEIQRELSERNAELSENRQMRFRIGINLGDVLEEGERIYGDGVNIAARMESLAQAGGICISGTVYDAIESKIGLGYEFLGEQEVKNIDKPVRAYRVLSYPGAAAHRVVRAKRAVRKTRRNMALAIVVVLLIFVAVAIWHFYAHHSPAKKEVVSVEKTAVPLPEKPSIVVLPFANMNEEPEQEFFSDGITEDIITDLSKVSGLFVIASNSSFSYKGKQVKIQDVAKDLGVRYVLEGSVRRSGSRVRITAQLIDAEAGDHLWAERYDREIKDIFSIQDQVTQKVVSELAVTLKASEAERLYRKHTENIEAYELYLRTIRECWPPKKKCYSEAIKSCKRIIELDPKFGGGYQLLSYLLSAGVRFGLSTSPSEDVEKSLEFGQQAVSVDDAFAPSYFSLASAYLMKRQHEDALAAASQGVRIEPGGYDSNMYLGFYLHWLGRGEEAVKALKKAQQFNPKYLNDRVPWILDFMGMACFTAGRYEESIEAWKQVLDRFGPLELREGFLSAAYSELGREDEAKAMARQLLKRHPKFSVSSWKYARTYKNPEDTERLLNALRKAGLPE
jgi:TolB-like protein/class 3 adenylate cyclase